MLSKYAKRNHRSANDDVTTFPSVNHANEAVDGPVPPQRQVCQAFRNRAEPGGTPEGRTA